MRITFWKNSRTHETNAYGDQINTPIGVGQMLINYTAFNSLIIRSIERLYFEVVLQMGEIGLQIRKQSTTDLV